MSTIHIRNAYFPSSGSAASRTFNSRWTDTGSALHLPGVWDTHSGSADVIHSITVTYSGAAINPTPAYVCVAQFLFSALGLPMVAPPGSLGWVSFLGVPVFLTRRSQSPTSPVVGVSAGSVLRVFKSDNTLRTESRWASVPTAVNGILAGRSFPDYAEATPVKVVDPTDYLVVEVGCRLTSFSATPVNVLLEFQLGDSHSAYAVNGSVAQGDSGCTIRWFSADSATSVNSTRLIKPLSPTIKPKVLHYPPVVERDSTIANEFTLGDKVL